MEYEAAEPIMEQIYLEIIKTEVEEVPFNTHIENEIGLNNINQEQVWVEFVKSEPALLVKEEILDSSKQAGTDEQQGIPTTSTHAIVGKTSVAADSVKQGELLHLEQEREDTDLDIKHNEPKHVDPHCRANQQGLIDIKQNNAIASLDHEEVRSSIGDDKVPCHQLEDKTTESSWKDKAALVQCHAKTFQCNAIKEVVQSQIYTCDMCKKTFKTKASVRSHITCTHGGQSYRCKLCKKNFGCQLYLLRHTKQVHEESKLQYYSCDKCLKVYKSKHYLRKHSKLVHEMGSHNCIQCNKEFKCKRYLLSHVQNTHSKEQSECYICKKMYKSRKSLRGHISRVHRNRFTDPVESNYRCDKCMKTFLSKIVFSRHCREIHGTKLYKCAECQREFKCKSYLTAHINFVHSKQRYVCEICKKTFKSKPTLRIHNLTVHSDRFPGIAVQQSVLPTSARPIFGRTNVATDNVKKGKLLHIKEELKDTSLDIGPTVLQHMDLRYRTGQTDLNGIKQENTNVNLIPEKVLSRIDDCQVLHSQVKDKTIESSWKDPEDGYYDYDKYKTFQSESILMSHIGYVHGTELYKCKECNKYYKCMRYLRSHIRYAHSKQHFVCDICKQIFRSKRMLTTHISRHRSDRFPGPLVHKYTCDHCQKSFWKKSVLRQHIQGVHGAGIHRCWKCNKIFKCRKYLQMHNTSIHGKLRHECEVCHTLFMTRRKLKAHAMKVHGLNDVLSKSDLCSRKAHVPRADN